LLRGLRRGRGIGSLDRELLGGEASQVRGVSEEGVVEKEEQWGWRRRKNRKMGKSRRRKRMWRRMRNRRR
jgi:hypothetical protein